MDHFNAAKALMMSFAPDEPRGNTEIESLKLQLEQQNLILQTLLVVMLEKKLMTEEEFKKWVREVDQLDGSRDGRLSEDKTMVPCPSCGKGNRKTAAKCEHCGRALEPDLLPQRPSR